MGQFLHRRARPTLKLEIAAPAECAKNLETFLLK
jgi:hypothetical protein